MNRVLLFFTLLIFTQCTVDPADVGTVEGVKPVYVTDEENVVEVQSARNFGNLGKIVYAAPYLLVNERFKGIHIVDNSVPAEPIKIAFVQIPGNTDFTIKGNFLYANQGFDFKTFALNVESSNLGAGLFSIEETDLINDLFNANGNSTGADLFPPNYTGFFECVDPDAGLIIGWEETTLINPECRI